MPNPEEKLPDLPATTLSEMAVDRRTFLTSASTLLLMPTLAEGQTNRPLASTPLPAPSKVYLMEQFGHGSSVKSAVFSANGRFILTGSDDNTARLWETATGKEVRRFVGHTRTIGAAVLSPDDRFVLTASEDNTARLWDASTGKEIQRFVGHTHPVFTVAFSPEGRYILSGGSDDSARLWETATGKEIRRFEGSGNSVNSVAFSPDGPFILTGSADKTARLWATATGKEIRRFQGHSREVTSVAFSADGRSLLTASEDKTARLWETATGKEIRRFEGHTESVWSVAFSPDSHALLTGSRDTTARLWETATGKEVRRFEGHSEEVIFVAFSRDGRSVLTASDDNTARLWETATGKEVRRFTGHGIAVYSASFSTDGRYILAAGGRAARLWETATGKEIRRLEAETTSAVFSADGRSVRTTNTDRITQLWDIATGKKIQSFAANDKAGNPAASSPNGRFVLTIRTKLDQENTVLLQETATGKEVRRFEGHTDPVQSAVFSADGRFVLTGSADKTARLWETVTGKEIRRFQGHGDSVNSAVFSPEGRFVLTASADYTIRMWETATGRELCRLISFDDGTWAVADPAGRYDASHGGDVQGLHWVVETSTGPESIALSQLKTRYYDPGLLAKYLGKSKEGLRNVATFQNVRLFPDVQLTPVAADSKQFTIHLRNRGGGLGKAVVRLNGKEVLADARGPRPNSDAAQASLLVDLTRYASLLQPGKENRIEVVAYNTEGYLAGRGVELLYTPSGKTTVRAPELYAIVAGISDYSSDSLHLNLPARDAAHFAQALTLGAKRLLGVEKVHLTLLTSDPRVQAGVRPTRSGFEQAFAQVKSAHPEDILVVYLAGHGVALQDEYYFLTQDARSFDLSDPLVRRQNSLSSEELAAWVTQIPAQKQVLILDTCAAGAAAKKLAEQRTVPGDQVRAMDRLKDRTGFYVLMGCASDAVSYEASHYGQGLLTYALLQGMQGAKLREDEYIDVAPLFEYAADRVPQLAEGIGGIQRPQILAPLTRQTPFGKQQASFDIGRLISADKQQIVLPHPRPLILRPVLINPKEVGDSLHLSEMLSKQLRAQNDVAARGGTVVYVEAEELPGAIQPKGTYMVVNGIVKVKLALWKDNQKIAELPIEGPTSDLPGLITQIVKAISATSGK